MLLPLRAQVGYASGNFGKSLLWTSLEYLLLFYLTDFAGISPATAGLIIFMSLAWDGLINPFVGYWLDLRASRGRDYRPFLRWAPPVTALLFVGIFLKPFGEGDLAIMYLFVILIAFRTGYALLDVPHNALLAFLPVGSGVRTNLAGFRYFFSSLGGLLIAAVAAPVVMQREDGATVLPDLVFLASIAGGILCLTLWQSLRPARLAQNERGHSPTPISPLVFLSAILRNRAAVLFLGLAAIFAVTTPLFGKMLPFVARYVQQEPENLGWAFAAMTVGQMSAMVICTHLARRFGRLKVGLVCLLLIPFLLLSAQFLLLGREGSLWLASGMFGFLLGGAIMVIWATAGDVADQIALLAKMRADAGLLAFFTMVQKAGIGMGAMLAGTILGRGEFQSGQSQSSGALDSILILGFLVPSVGALGGAFLLFELYRHYGFR